MKVVHFTFCFKNRKIFELEEALEEFCIHNKQHQDFGMAVLIAGSLRKITSTMTCISSYLHVYVY